MFNNAALDVVIGLVFIYLLYSLLGTLLQEIVAANIGLRGFVLRMALRRMLDDNVIVGKFEKKLPTADPGKAPGGEDGKGRAGDGSKTPAGDVGKALAGDVGEGASPLRLSEAFYGYPLIKYLRPNSFWLRKLPAYISNDAFSKVMIDLLAGDQVQPGDSHRPFIQKSLDNETIAWIPNVPIEGESLRYVRSLWADAQGDVQRFRQLLEGWYTEMMRMTSSWYKKYTQLILLAVGLLIAIVFNVDTLKIAEKLQKDPKARAAIVAQATEFSRAHPNLQKELAQQKAELDSLSNKLAGPVADSLKKDAENSYRAARDLRDSLVSQAAKLTKGDITQANTILGIGWDHGFWDPQDRDARSAVGWLLTSLAISLGAPFWFDLLNKLMKLRSSVSPDEGKTASGTGKSGNTPKQTERVG